MQSSRNTVLRRHLARVVLGTALTVLLAPVSTAAQTCGGFGRFSDAPNHVRIGATFGDGFYGFGGSWANGGKAVFSGLGLGLTHIDAWEGNSLWISSNVGFQVPLSREGDAQFCPIAAFDQTSGPNDILGTGVNYRDWRLSFGGSFGFVATRTQGGVIVPAVSVRIETVRSTLKSAGGKVTDSETFGRLSLSLGIAMRAATVRPTVSVPIGLEGAKPSYGIGLSINIPRRTAR